MSFTYLRFFLKKKNISKYPFSLLFFEQNFYFILFLYATIGNIEEEIKNE